MYPATFKVRNVFLTLNPMEHASPYSLVAITQVIVRNRRPGMVAYSAFYLPTKVDVLMNCANSLNTLKISCRPLDEKLPNAWEELGEEYRTAEHFKKSQLQDFISEATHLADMCRGDNLDTPSMLASFYELIREAEWFPHIGTDSDSVPYKQYLLHCDPLDRFSLVGVVWSPGHRPTIHSPDVWCYVGILRGAALSQRYRQNSDISRQKDARNILLEPGDIEILSPQHGDSHFLANAYDDRAAVTIHIYGGNVDAAASQALPTI